MDERETRRTEDTPSEPRVVGEPGREPDAPEVDARDERPTAALADADADDTGPLLRADEASDFERRWKDVQAAFVDQPRDAVARADRLVEELMERLTGSFAEARAKLESQWDAGGDVSTEDLRLALRRYRTFFERLLSA